VFADHELQAPCGYLREISADLQRHGGHLHVICDVVEESWHPRNEPPAHRPCVLRQLRGTPPR
jgi:hypothetical protein